MHIDGLTDFLIEEYFKKYGIYSTDAGELQKFWKSHVSAVYRELRQQKLQMRKTQADFATGADLNDFGFDPTFGISDIPPAGKPPMYGTPGPKGTRSGLKGGSKTLKPELPQDNFQKKYNKYSRLLELDVFMTVQRDINEMEDVKRQQNLRMQDTLKQRQTQEKRNQRVKKMESIVEAYYAEKVEDRMRQEKAKALK